MAKGYDPYNKPAKRPKGPKTPDYKKASPNNPRNNAGPKVKATSSAKGGRAASAKAQSREFGRVYNTKTTGPNNFEGMKGKGFAPATGEAQFKSGKAGYDMARKNAAKKVAVDKARAARPSKIGWAKAGGAKAKGSMVKWGTAAATNPASKVVTGSSAARFAGAVARGANAMGAVLLAGQAGYAVGTAIYNKNATKIQDTLDKVVRGAGSKTRRTK